MTEFQDPGASRSAMPFRILSLDGGGAKGFYTLGVLKELEAISGEPLNESFDLVYGTSTGAIIAALVALGRRVDDIRALYQEHVPSIMSARTADGRSDALANASEAVFGDARFEEVVTGVGIVATRWQAERPMIFKASIGQAHGRKSTFTPGFGVRIADAVQASCSAFPFFNRKMIKTSAGDEVELMDGGFCANNPTLYAIADAAMALKVPRSEIRVVSVGVGEYPRPSPTVYQWLTRQLLSVRLLQKTLECNTQSMDQLRQVLFGDVATVRISDAFTQPELATDLLEHDLAKLNVLRQKGADSFASRESRIRELLAN